MNNMNEYVCFLKKAYVEHKEESVSWTTLAKKHHKLFGAKITNNALKNRAYRAYFSNNYMPQSIEQSNQTSGSYNKDVVKGTNKKRRESQNSVSSEIGSEFTQHNLDGTIEASTIVNSIESLNGNKSEILKLLGYNEKEWELLSWRITIWDGGQAGATKYSVKYKIKPIVEPSPIDYTQAVVDAINKTIKPLKLKSENQKALKNNRLMEIPPVELHLGKMGSVLTTGEDYNIPIAKERFYDIFRRVIDKQRREQCEKCLIVIGSDFFNSESDNATTTHKIQQQNCASYLDLFTEGLEMYLNVIKEVRQHFSSVNVMLCAGNHARAMEFFLYVALQQAFKCDDIVKFSTNYQETQYFEFGENVIFYNHGDFDIKRTMQSIPAEFPSIWGKHKFRELHLGHLHKEVVVDDDLGMITRRVGSPCGTDFWHKLNRYVGATKKHQIFIWDKQFGLSDIYYIPVKL